MQLKTKVTALIFCLVALAGIGAAQDITGSISGTVADSSGAVVPNASVTITNVDKNQVLRTVTTDSNGSYSATLLPVGMYTLVAEKQGFKRVVLEKLQLNVNDKLTENFSLPPGQSQQSVTVEADALEVELQSAQPSGLISGAQVREIPLNNRNYEQLVALQPGVAYGGPDQLYVGATSPFGTNVVSFSINGQRNSSNNWTVDGADNVDRGSNLTLLTFPSVDAIAEFKTIRGNYSAEFGRSASGQINVVTKSGTRDFHGDAYEFFRNDVLNANTFFNKRATKPLPRSPLRYNDFGYTIGGPLFIPGVYNTARDKTFVFFSQEYRRVITYPTVSGTVPTAGERQGNFAAPVCTKVTVTAGSPSCSATGTQITAIDPVAAAYLKDVISKLPLPNNPSDPHGLITTYRSIFNDRQDLLKADQVFGSKVSAFFRYIHDTFPSLEPGGLFTSSPLPGVATTSTGSPGTSYLGHATLAFSPTLLADIGYGYSSGAIISHPIGLISPANSPDVKVALPFTSTLARIPSLSFTGGSGITSFGPYNDYNRNHNVFANLSKVIGKHTFRAGGTYNHYQKTENNGGNNAGTFAFNTFGNPGGRSNNFPQSFANFLSGYVNQFSQASQDLTPDILTNQYEAYAQDEWHIRPNLTINFGGRYSYFQQPRDDKRLLTNFDPESYSAAKAPAIDANGNICTTAPCAGGVTPNPNYDPMNGLIVNNQNSPFGARVGRTDTHDIVPRIGLAWDPYGDGKTSIRAGYGTAYDSTLFGIYEQNIFQNPPFVQSVAILSTQFSNPTAGTPRISLLPPALHATPVNGKTPYTQEWSLDFQRQVVRNLIFDIGYYATKGTHLLVIEDVNQPLPDAFLTTPGINPAGAFSGSTLFENQLNQIRPYKGYGPINQLLTAANSNYNALQSELRWKFSGSSEIGMAYTWSHCLTNSRTDRSNAPENTYNIQGEYGRCQLDRRHIFTANYIYDLPFFRGSHNVLEYVLGGWEAAGIVSISSGLPLNPGTFASYDPAGQGLQLSSSAAGLRPDIIGDPNSGAPHTIAQWFNTSAFADVPVGQYRPGNSHPGAINGPGFQRFDFSLYKNIPVHEDIHFQFRAEAFNVFNHTNYDSVSTTLGSSSYGQVTGARDPRVMQLGLKFYF